MATSGSTSVAATSQDTLKFSWELTSQSVANNTSTISWKLELIAGSSGYISSSTAKDWSVTVNGTKYTGTNTIGIANNATKTLASGTTIITHNSDGTKTFTYSFSQELAITWGSTYIGTKSGSGSGTLTTIPRKSTMSVENGTLGTAQTITVTRQSTSFTHTIRYSCGDYNGYVCQNSSNTSISWTPPLDFAQSAPNGTSVSVSLTIDTYNGSTLVGSNSYPIKCTIPSSVKPTVSFTVSDGNGYLSTYGGYIQGKSTLKIEITASGSQGSTIKSYKTTADGKTYTSDSFTSSVIAGSGTLTITVTVTDSRGRTATATKNVTVLAYAAPKITAFKAERCTSDGTLSNSGSYLKITFTAAITSLSSKNGAAYVLQYKKSSATSYSSVTLSSYAGKYSVSGGIYVFAADAASSYNLILKATDNFSSTTANSTGPSITKLWSWLKSNKGIAFGKIAELAEYFDVAWNARFRKNVTVDGTVTGNDVLTASGVSLAELNTNKVQIKLLWENSSKTSSFASQTLSLGLNSYDMYVVVARYSSSVGGTTSTICKTGYSSRLQGVGSSASTNSNDATVSQESIRTVTYNSGSLSIGNAVYQGVQKNDALIPIFIYGVKGVA